MKKLIIPAGEKELLAVYSHVDPFDKGVSALRKEGLELITARDLAYVRLLGGAKSPMSREWTWVAENFNYFPNGDILIASKKYSPLLRKGSPEEATECRRQGKEFYLDKKIAKELCERAEVDPTLAIKSGVLLLHRKAVKSEIPSTALKDAPLMYFLFKDTAKQYGQFLKENNIDSVPTYFVDADYAKKQKQPFGRALWVNNHILRSILDGDNDYLHLNNGGRVRGVRRYMALN